MFSVFINILREYFLDLTLYKPCCNPWMSNDFFTNCSRLLFTIRSLECLIWLFQFTLDKWILACSCYHLYSFFNYYFIKFIFVLFISLFEFILYFRYFYFPYKRTSQKWIMMMLPWLSTSSWSYLLLTFILPQIKNLSNFF